MEVFQLFFIRNIHSLSLRWRDIIGTRAVWIAVAVVTAAQLAMTWMPWMQELFQTDGLTAVQSVQVLLCGVALFVILEAEKQVRLRWPGGHHSAP